MLGVLETHPQHDLLVPVNGFQEFIGPTNCVHWYRNDADESEFHRIAEGSPVRFRCDEHTTCPDETKDRRRVHFMHVEPCGGLVIPESLCSRWQSGEATIPLNPPPCPVFIQSSDRANLIGPWRTETRMGSSVIVPRRPPTVFRYDLAEVRGKYLLQIYRHPTVPDASVIGVNEMPFAGEPVDVATPTQLSNWLKKKLNQVISAQRIKELDAAYPGWKKGLAEAVRDARPDEQQRWRRVEECLDSVLGDAAAIEVIKTTTSYKDAVSRAVKEELVTQKDEIAAKAKRLANEQTEPLEREIAKLEARKKDLSDKIKVEERRLKQPAEILSQLREFVASDFERLKTEAAVLSSVLGSARSPNNTKPSTSHASLVIKPDAIPFKEVDLPKFLASRFHPAMAELMIGLPEADVKNALATVIGSRATILPDARWFFAFRKAFNAQGEVAHCDPRWLTWVDAWRDLGAHWIHETESSCWKFILIQDFDIAIPELWARPILNVIARVTENLPGGATWPERLRLFLVPTQGDAALPISHHVLTHFSAIKLTAQYSRPESKLEFGGFRMDESRRPSKQSAVEDVTLASDAIPCRLASSEKVVKQISRDFDGVMPGVASDVDAISRVLTALGAEIGDATESALRMRCGWISNAEESA